MTNEFPLFVTVIDESDLNLTRKSRLKGVVRHHAEISLY